MSSFQFAMNPESGITPVHLSMNCYTPEKGETHPLPAGIEDVTHMEIIRPQDAVPFVGDRKFQLWNSQVATARPTFYRLNADQTAAVFVSGKSPLSAFVALGYQGIPTNTVVLNPLPRSDIYKEFPLDYCLSINSRRLLSLIPEEELPLKITSSSVDSKQDLKERQNAAVIFISCDSTHALNDAQMQQIRNFNNGHAISQLITVVPPPTTEELKTNPLNVVGIAEGETEANFPLVFESIRRAIHGLLVSENKTSDKQIYIVMTTPAPCALVAGKIIHDLQTTYRRADTESFGGPSKRKIEKMEDTVKIDFLEAVGRDRDYQIAFTIFF